MKRTRSGGRTALISNVISGVVPCPPRVSGRLSEVDAEDAEESEGEEPKDSTQICQARSVRDWFQGQDIGSKVCYPIR